MEVTKKTTHVLLQLCSFTTHLKKVSPASVRVYSRLPGWLSDSSPPWMFFEKTSRNQTFIIPDDKLDVWSRSRGPLIWHLLKTLLHLPSLFHPLYLPPSLSDMIFSYHQTPPTAAPPAAQEHKHGYRWSL